MSLESSSIEVLLDVMRRRKNFRHFKPDPIPDEYIDAIVDAARLAPSGANSQPWELIVIKDPERKERIFEIFVEAATKGHEQIDPKFPAPSDAVHRAKLVDAPVLLAVCGDPRFRQAYPGYGFRDAMLYESIGIVMAHIHLAAVALGLAIGWGTINQFSEAPIGELLDVPPPLIVKEIFQLGFPIAEPPAKFRREIRNVVHFERLDTRKLRTDEEIGKMIETRRTADVYSGRNAEA